MTSTPETGYGNNQLENVSEACGQADIFPDQEEIKVILRSRFIRINRWYRIDPISPEVKQNYNSLTQLFLNPDKK